MKSEQVPAKVLICDDERGSLLVLESIMESLSLETVSAMSVAGAKKVLSEIVPRYAILDVLLPDGDGIDVLLHIRAARLPTAVALITATLSEFPYHKCGTILPDKIFSKPLDPAAVIEWIQKSAPAHTVAEKLTLKLPGSPIVSAPERGERLTLDTIAFIGKGAQPAGRHAVVIRHMSDSELEILCGENLPVGSQFILPISRADDGREVLIKCSVVHCEHGGSGGSQYIIRAAFSQILQDGTTASAA